MKKVSYFLLTKSVGLYINVLNLIAPKKAFALTFKFFSEPRKGRLSHQNLPDFLQSTQIDEYLLDNKKFYTYTWPGNENTILLVHGWESNSARWEKFLPYLQKSGSTVVAIDGPAHGLSDGKIFNLLEYADMIAIVAQQINPQILIGHSLGGKTCLYYQSIYQNPIIQKIVTLGSPSDFYIIYKNFINTLSLSKSIANTLKDFYIRNFEVDFRELSISNYGSNINTKGLIAHDIEDTIVLPVEGDKIAKTWTNTQLIHTKGLGHSMHDEDLYGKISEFLFN